MKCKAFLVVVFLLTISSSLGSYCFSEEFQKDSESSPFVSATFNFQYDDGNKEDPELADLFEQFGFTCGFALYKRKGLNIPFYLSAQDRGFEILAHGTTKMGTDSELSVNDVSNIMTDAKEYLIALGFSINGWVTPYSVLKDDYQEVCNSKFEYATTGTLGAFKPNDKRIPCLTKHDSPMNIKRISTDASSLDGLIYAVDVTIKDGGFTTFYGHHFDNPTEKNNTTRENLTGLLMYLKEKVDSGECLVLPPREAVRSYFN